MDLENFYQMIDFTIMGKLNKEQQPTFIVMNEKTLDRLILWLKQRYILHIEIDRGNVKYRGLDVLISENLKNYEFKIG